MADEKNVLTYKGHPLMRKDNLIEYGSMADPYNVMHQVLKTNNAVNTDVTIRVSVEL